ncbi:MAG TPA: glycoside hydrolase family 95 protein, partial [Bacteroidales bacterium]|nr:glycoside hydrolase family 95 protein [Bacteroidales bacterium]
MNYFNNAFTCLVFLWLSTGLYAQSDHLLWYDKPAGFFEESLPLGNGTMGAAIFGGSGSDKIYLNDATLWSGEPVDPDMNPRAQTYIPLIREALHKGDYKAADSLNHFVQGSFSQSYAPLGTVFLETEHKGPAIDYRRELDISRAVSVTRYEVDGIRYTREYFISHPDKVMVIKLTSAKKNRLGFKVHFSSLLHYSSASDSTTLRITGYAPYKADPNYHGNQVLFDPDRGMRYTTLFRVRHQDGTLTLTDSTLELRGSSEAVIFISEATSF